MERLTVGILAFSCFCLFLPPSSATELLVKWKDGPDSQSALEAHAKLGTIAKRNFRAIGWQLVQLPDEMSLDDGLKAFCALSEVQIVEPNRIIPAPESLAVGEDRTVSQLRGSSSPSPGVVPNDPMFSQQWYLKKISATNAWATTTGSSNVVVAIFDTGIDYHHADLARNVWRNPGEIGIDALGRDRATNGLDDDGNGYVDDVYGIDAITGRGDPVDEGFMSNPGDSPNYHGTFVAGLIGAVANNQLGISGLNQSVSILTVKVWSGPEWPIPSFLYYYNAGRLLAGFEYVLAMKKRGVNIRAINHSEGLIAYSAAVQDAIIQCYEEGILNIVAADNNTVDHDVFSTYLNVQNSAPLIYVAATDESDSLTWFSDYGRSTVHLAAPGINMLSLKPGNGYRTGGAGTSYSAPLVAGAAALLAAVRPALTADQMKAALLGSVDHPSALRSKVITGGRLNVARALAYLTNAGPPAIVLSALPAGQRTPLNHPIEVRFSQPMDRGSVEQWLRITPPLGGSFEWSADSRSVIYRHEVPFDRTAIYTVRLSGAVLDASGGTLDGNYDQTQSGAPGDDLTWTFRFPPANDYFADAQPITGYNGSITGNTRGAILEPVEPNLGFLEYALASVWYRWDVRTDPGADVANQWTTFDLGSTPFDCMVGVFTGTELVNLTPVATNTSYGTRRSGRVSLPLSSSRSYWISIIANNSAPTFESRPFTLKWYPTPPPGFTGSQFTPSTATPGAKITLTGTNFTGATAVIFNGVAATFTNAPTNNLDLRITAIVPPNADSGPITILTPHGNVTSTATFQILRPTINLSRTAAGELTLSWTDSALHLESSTDLKAWTAVTAKAPTTTTVHSTNNHVFFRLRGP